MTMLTKTSRAAMAALAVLVSVAACTTPQRPDKGDTPALTVRKDIAYADAEPAGSRGHLLDLYVPSRPGKGLRPLLIVTGGSAWRGDDGKTFAEQVAPHFTSAGYIVAGVSIRSSAQARFPAQLHDAKAAVRWLRAYAPRYGIDPSRIAIMGTSSGGWAATMVGVTSDVPQMEGTVGVTGVSSRVSAVIDMYGPTDFPKMDRKMLPDACTSFNQMMGLTDCHNDPNSPESQLIGCAIQACKTVAREANPITYLSATDPPLLIAHGQDDALVPHDQSQLLYQAARQRCVTATWYSVPGVGHSTGIMAPTVATPVVRSTAGCQSTKVDPRAARPTLATIQSWLESLWR